MVYNSARGMPYGGMPESALLDKLEINDAQGDDDLEAILHEGEYNDYARKTLVDRGPDAPTIEADKTRRDPALSRSTLNIRYNGTRGNDPALPHHPEMFIGFVDRDPRGHNSAPLFNQARDHMNSRFEQHRPRLGDNSDLHLTESPWTAQGIDSARQSVNGRVASSMKVFNSQLESVQPNNNNVVSRGGNVVAQQIVTLDDTTMNNTSTRAHKTAGDVVAGWHKSSGDSTLGVHRYTAANKSSAKNYVGEQVRKVSTDQEYKSSQENRTQNRNVVAAIAATVASTDMDQVAKRTDETMIVNNVRPHHDGHVARHIDEDTIHSASNRVEQHNLHGLRPTSDPAKAAYKTVAAKHTPIVANIEHVVSRLHEHSAGAKRAIAGAVEVDGKLAASSENRLDGRRLGVHTNTGAATWNTQVDNVKDTTRTVHVYKGQKKYDPEQRVRPDALDNNWQNPNVHANTTAKHPEWRSATQDDVHADVDLVREDDAVANGGTFMRTKIVRANEHNTESINDDINF